MQRHAKHPLSRSEIRTLTLQTDGVTDALSERDNFFGAASFVRLLKGHVRADSQAVMRAIARGVVEFVDMRRLLDDVMIVAIKRMRLPRFMFYLCHLGDRQKHVLVVD